MNLCLFFVTFGIAVGFQTRVAGAVIEHKLTQDWSLGVEALYMTSPAIFRASLTSTAIFGQSGPRHLLRPAPESAEITIVRVDLP